MATVTSLSDFITMFISTCNIRYVDREVIKEGQGPIRTVEAS